MRKTKFSSRFSIVWRKNSVFFTLFKCIHNIKSRLKMYIYWLQLQIYIDFFRIGLRKLRKRPDLNSCAAKSGWLRRSWNLVWVYSNACQLWMNLLQLSEYSLPSTWVYTIRNSSLNSIKNINRILSTRSSFFSSIKIFECWISTVETLFEKWNLKVSK